MQIYLARNNEQAGPYTLEQVNRMLASGQVVLTDLAWHEGMANWQPLQQLTGGRLYYDPNPSPSPFQSAPVSPITGSAQTNTNTNISLQKSSTPQTLTHAAPIAPISKRLLGAAIDFCLITLTSLPTLQYLDMAKIEKASQNNDMMQVITQMQAGIPQDAQLISNILLFAICAVQLLLISRRGQSIGKLIMGTQIVQEDQKTPATFGKAIWVRTVLPWVLYSLPVINIVFFMATLTALLISPRRQSLHDRLAKTVVVELPKSSSPHA
jgi:uncharacterized RDD family membrane protein YckC